MKELFIDVETTGLDENKNAIHQISGAVVIDGVEMETFDFNVRPFKGAIINKQALNVGGVTMDQLRSYPEARSVYLEFIKILDRYVSKYDSKDKFFFFAYNAAFDNKFVRAFFLQNGDKYFGSYFWSGTIDVMVLALEYLKKSRHLMNNFKLMTVAKFLQIEVDETKAHDSLYDIVITKKVYDATRQIKLY